jgi:hypothetical protein
MDNYIYADREVTAPRIRFTKGKKTSPCSKRKQLAELREIARLSAEIVKED